MDMEQRLARLLSAIEKALAKGSGDRYVMAMIGRALAVVRRDLEGGIDAPECNLNLNVYGERSRSLDRLAKDIRARTLADRAKQELPVVLFRYVEERLKRWSPDPG